MTLDERRNCYRSNTVEDLDRDIRLMKEMLEIREEVKTGREVDLLLNRYEIERLRKRIPELEASREELRCTTIA
jgi:hypothetical protein